MCTAGKCRPGYLTDNGPFKTDNRPVENALVRISYTGDPIKVAVTGAITTNKAYHVYFLANNTSINDPLAADKQCH